MGNIVVTGVRSGVDGDDKYTEADITGSTSYATGGDTLTAAQLGFSTKIQGLAVSPTGTVANQRIWSFNFQADGSVKIQLATAINTEVANTTNVTTQTARIRANGY